MIKLLFYIKRAHHLIIFPAVHTIRQYHDKKVFFTDPSRKVCNDTITNTRPSHYLCPKRVSSSNQNVYSLQCFISTR